jgi:hypothetical protein
MWIAESPSACWRLPAPSQFVGSIPASYASIPTRTHRHTAQLRRAGPRMRASAMPQANAAITQASINRRNPAWCPGCGVVESMREIEPSGEVGRQELTIRFRDGGTIVLNEATRRSWRLGNRVIVIGGLNTPGR